MVSPGTGKNLFLRTYINIYISVALFTNILTIKNCRKCKTKIKEFHKNTYDNLKCKNSPNFTCKTTLS